MLGRIRVYLIMFAAFSAFAGVAYWYYKDTQQALQQYALNQATLETGIQLQQNAVQSLKRDIVVMTSTISDLNTKFQQSRERVDQLENTFNTTANGNDRDLGQLAAEKPALIERAVNNGTKTVGRCIELLSGAEPTPKDRTNEELVDCITAD